MNTQSIFRPVRSLRTLRFSLTLLTALLTTTLSWAQSGNDSTSVQVHAYVTSNGEYLKVGVSNPGNQRFSVKLVTRKGEVLSQYSSTQKAIRYWFNISNLPAQQYYLVVKDAAGEEKRALTLTYQPARMVGTIEPARVDVAER